MRALALGLATVVVLCASAVSQEAAEWEEFVGAKLNQADAPWLSFSAYDEKLAQMRAEFAGRPGTVREVELLDALAAHGEELAAKYPARGPA